MEQSNSSVSYKNMKFSVLNDYRTALLSRECSLMGRREVLTGKAKFGIFGDGKELPQLAMARAFRSGDFRSGYYRDQTFMMAIGEFTVEHFFAGLYAHTDLEAEPNSGGRQMNGHFSTHSLNEKGEWNNLVNQKNTSSDISCTAGQMPRLVGLAQASKVYRQLDIPNSEKFSKRGNEIAWGTIGNASTSEGVFFEAVNAAGVLQIPMVISVWDDEYGISVPAKYQTTKESISEVLKGFQRDEDHDGFEIMVVKGWDYPALMETYEKAASIARRQHVPVLIHVTELTQPQGHSTSGSHERYKSEERLQWELEHDCITKMRSWILENDIATEEEVLKIEEEAVRRIKEGKKKAWEAYLEPIQKQQQEAIDIIKSLAEVSQRKGVLEEVVRMLSEIKSPNRKQIIGTARKALACVIGEENEQVDVLRSWIDENIKDARYKYDTYLYSESDRNPVFFSPIEPQTNDASEQVDGRIIIRDNFDYLLAKHPNLLIFGEDSGSIGDVNQGLEGLQEKYGEIRVADTGIREATIIGQGIGMAMRGLRPIAEIQYLDYIYYALFTLTDDLASLHYRTFGRQSAPMIIRTRGHRLEGIWHAGSPMGALLNSLRGVYILVPRNMTKAAGFYNALLEGDQPALVIESLNGYRLKEAMPENLGEFRTPIGVVETIKEGKDITLVSYGSTLRMVHEVALDLLEFGIDAEVIDVQSLIPFDVRHDILESVKKTNRLLVIDEDLPGAASAYILREIIEVQGGYMYLDSAPQTLTAKAHRPAFGTDGDYFSKPSMEDIFEKVYAIMHESNPKKYPRLR